MTLELFVIGLLVGYVLWRLFILEPYKRVERQRLNQLIQQGKLPLQQTPERISSCVTVPNVSKTPEEDFINTAKELFMKISNAYANSDKQTLKDLLSPYVYERFCESIDQRAADKLKTDFQLARFEEVKILQHTYRLNEVKVRFVTWQLNYTKNEEEKIVQGALDRLEIISDIWEFERRRDVPYAWKVCSTQSESLV